MFAEMGNEKLNEALWAVYVAWPVDGDTTEVTRWNRKKHQAGEEGADTEKKTWPLPYEGDTSITSLLAGVGWEDALVAAVKTALIDQKEDNDVHPNCTESEMTWPDLQQAFRATVNEGEWEKEDDVEYPVLHSKVSNARPKPNLYPESPTFHILPFCHRWSSATRSRKPSLWRF